MTDTAKASLMDGWAKAMAGDFASLKEICSSDCRVWHSSDNKWRLHREVLEAFLARDQRLLPLFRDVRMMTTLDGFLCQTTASVDKVGPLHILQLMKTEGSLITQIEEYIGPEMNLRSQAAE